MTNLNLVFEPFFPWLVLAVLILPVALLVAWALWTKSAGAAVRALALAALALALANPVLVQEERVAQPSTVALIVDESQSQRLEGRSEDTETAVAALTEQLGEMPEVELRTVRISSTGENGPNSETRLFDALSTTFADVAPSRIGGAIIVSDGQVHDAPETADSFGFEGPLHALITGRPDEFDRRVEIVQAPRFSIINQDLTVNYRVIDEGRESTTPVEIEVYRNGELLSIEPAVPGEDVDFTMQLDRAGKNIIEFRAEVADGELTETNNRAVVRIEGIRENLRVLLVSGEPHTGERAWRNLLKSDASVDLVHFTILRPPEKQDGTPINELSLIAFPTRELFVEKIEDFDLIIFDRYQNRNVLPLLYYDYISEYVRNGGALLIAAGPEYAARGSLAQTPLVGSLPALPSGTVAEVGFRPSVTEQGNRHPVTRDLTEGTNFSADNWGRWLRIVDVDDTDGTVVLEGADDRPLLILERVGEGRVGLMLSDQGWLWARGFEGGGPYLNLYRRTAHWLMREPDLEEETLSAEGSASSLTITRQTMADEVDEAVITTPSGDEIATGLTEVEDGIFETEVEIDEIGLYRVTNGDLTALANVGPVDAPEFRDMLSTTERLAVASDATGGEVRRLRNSAGLLDGLDVPDVRAVRASASKSGNGWIGLNMSTQTRLVGVERQSLFGGLLGLAVLLAAFAAMWWREGQA
ncbi:MAG: hypothetical protein AAGI92_06130 [Pseudomonadota bacterium]